MFYIWIKLTLIGALFALHYRNRDRITLVIVPVINWLRICWDDVAYRNNRVLRRDWICFVIVVFDLGTLAQFARRPSRDGEVIFGEHIEEDRYDSKFHFEEDELVDWMECRQ